ncbi:cytochrome b/b6 domain-containing protein [Candidatus Comchoanobacter bicostacola]|uniref:Cytochrome b/b6 domain-containing protein n=1 Tax=Candidatus Comchoanobacter bicostacola TaxID=2919598 RepID=A0ABY5DK98_9GAMM|nr:cytochrome b/b6 domain-containing protein [Candidatus Comchoanobacter bicostacola]UTC24913.1 cytochrome b/b6 domain-containing protein [Candidatus Comchoanobacter bicostacola]
MLWNTVYGYGTVSRLFHWVIGLMIIAQLAVGFWMVGLPNEVKGAIYANHKIGGLLVLFLVLFRLVWRWVNVLPNLPEKTPKWQIFAARSLHRFFYVLMLFIPISGWVMSTASGFFPKIGGVVLMFPWVSAPELCILGTCYTNSMIAVSSNTIHCVLGLVLVGALCIHTSIAVWHAYLADGVFSRIVIDKTQS